MADMITELISTLLASGELETEDGLTVSFSAKPPITDEDLMEVQQSLWIPQDYIALLQKWDGLSLYQYEDVGGYLFFGSMELDDENSAQREMYGDRWDSKVTVFAVILGEGNFLGFRKIESGAYEVIDCYHENDPAEWPVIAKSLGEFVERLVASKGHPYWL